MGDRELLEMAAKAADYPHDARWLNYPEGSAPPQQHYWDPLTDDGDALRLAVKLKAEIDVGPNLVAVRLPQGIKTLEEVGADPYAATRRAITRAAAEIGKSGSAASGQGGGV